MKYEVGMEVERCFDSRWVGPCIVIGVATSVINGTQSINIKYLNNREQDEEFGVLDSFIRLAKTTSALEKSSTLRQVCNLDKCGVLDALSVVMYIGRMETSGQAYFGPGCTR
jgi:hypothetical protein